MHNDARCRVDGPKKTADGQYIRFVEMTFKQTIWNYQKDDAGLLPFIATLHTTVAALIALVAAMFPNIAAMRMFPVVTTRLLHF
eukprot:2544961-Rhodomonas_salina.2